MLRFNRPACFVFKTVSSKLVKANIVSFQTRSSFTCVKKCISLRPLAFPKIRFLSTKNLPPFELLRLPSLSPTMETGTVVSWAKNEGDYIEDGGLLAEVETDKATIGFEVIDGGYIAKIFVQAGEKNVPLGAPMCILVKKPEDIAAFKDYTAAEADKDKPRSETPSSDSTTSAPPETATANDEAKVESGGKKTKPVFASNLARKLAADLGIDLSYVKGTGPKGRIVAEDVENFAKSKTVGATAPGSTQTKVSEVVDIVEDSVNRYTKSKTQIPHYYLTMDVEVDEISNLCTRMNEMLKEDAKLQLIDFIVKASALSCLIVPDANSVWKENSIRKYASVDINVDGKIIKGSEKLNLRDIRKSLDISSESSSVGGSFAVKQLKHGVLIGAEIIDPSHACVLTVADPRKVVLPSTTGTRVATTVSFTLSCDHRVVDGASGALWLQNFKRFIEHPSYMLL